MRIGRGVRAGDEFSLAKKWVPVSSPVQWPSVTDPKTAAFHRLLSDAHQGGQAKVDALVVLVQRTVFVVPWPAGIEGFRTLVNSDGVAALPIFSVPTELEEAARRYGWLAADGSAPRLEIGARQALNYAIGQNLAFVVVDIAAEHALELTRSEFEPLLSAAARRDSEGPYAAAGKISSNLLRKVTPTPGSLRAPNPIEPPKGPSSPSLPAAQAPAHAPSGTPMGQSPAAPVAQTPAAQAPFGQGPAAQAPAAQAPFGQGPAAQAPVGQTPMQPLAHPPGSQPVGTGPVASGQSSSPGVAAAGSQPGVASPAVDDGFTVKTGFDPSAATFGGGTSVTLSSLAEPAQDALYDALTAVLRGYPEIEWAALCNASRGPSAAVPTVGLRVDTSFRQRVQEIVMEVRRAGEKHGATLDVLLLDDPNLMRSARASGVFYPWRKK